MISRCYSTAVKRIYPCPLVSQPTACASDEQICFDTYSRHANINSLLHLRNAVHPVAAWAGTTPSRCSRTSARPRSSATLCSRVSWEPVSVWVCLRACVLLVFVLRVECACKVIRASWWRRHAAMRIFLQRRREVARAASELLFALLARPR